MAIALVQDGKAGNNTSSSTSVAVTLSATTAGNLLVASVGLKDGTGVSSITGGGTWVKAVDTGFDGISQTHEIWYCENCSSGVTSVTINYAATRSAAWVGEFSGAATTNALDTTGSTNGTTGNTANPGPGSYTPSQATGVAIMGAVWANTSTTISARPTGFTAPTNGNSESGAASSTGTESDTVYKIDPGTSAINLTWTISAARTWGATAAVFKQAGGGGTTITLGLPTETDTPNAVARAKTKTTGLATETDTALAMGRAKTKTLGAAAESDVAHAITAVKTRVLGLPSETDTAHAVAVRPIKINVGPVTETDTAHAITRVKTKTLGHVTETDAPLAVGRAKSKTLGAPGTTDAPAALLRVKTRTVGLPTEADTAFPITVGGGGVVLGKPTEVDTAHAITARKTRVLGLPTEVDTPTGVVRVKTRTLTRPTEADTAHPTARLKTKALGLPTETDTAHAVGVIGGVGAPNYRRPAAALAGAGSASAGASGSATITNSSGAELA